MPWYTISGESLRIRVRARARAGSFEAAALPDRRLKLRLTAAPVDGKANDQAAKTIAGLLGVPRPRVSLASGASSRDRTFMISGIADGTGLPDSTALPGGFYKL